MAIRVEGTPPLLESEGKKTNPGDATVHADTGALAEGVYEVRIFVGGSAAGLWAVQRRNAANGANVGDVLYLYSAAGQTGQYVATYHVNTSERIRIVNDGAITGTEACTLQVERVL